MRSIRLSLLVYFLVLLALALGAVSVLAYQTTQRILEAKETVRHELFLARYKENCQRESDKLDDFLQQQARTLAGQARLPFFGARTGALDNLPMYLLNTRLLYHETLAGPDRGRGFWHGPLSRMILLKINEDLLPHARGEEDEDEEDSGPAEYFQINREEGISWHSQSMGDRFFPFDREQFKDMLLYETSKRKTEFQPGIRVRLLTFKAPLAPTWFIQRGPRNPGYRERPPEPRQLMPGTANPPSEPRPRPQPVMYIHCAAETTQRDAALAALTQQLDEDTGRLKAESTATMASLRNRLLLISLTTFGASVLGGFWLVQFGLSPLRRLSEAVSKVSPKDFRLPFDASRLPRELHPIVDRLTQTLDLLKRTFAREKQAAADISHELRTPLAALLTTTEVALRKPRLAEEYREMLADCHSAGKQMSQLVERLLALARLDAGVDTLRPREVEVSLLAEQCAALVRPLAEARGLQLTVHRKGPIHLITDPDKLREVVTNLLHNAIEYNRPQGQVDLRVTQNNGDLQVEVRDTGIGITPEARECIFERFYRADPSRRADGLHAGLGLAIVKGYVDLMGGTITVESTLGDGSTFRLSLPIHQRSEGHPAREASRE